MLAPNYVFWFFFFFFASTEVWDGSGVCSCFPHVHLICLRNPANFTAVVKKTPKLPGKHVCTFYTPSPSAVISATIPLKFCVLDIWISALNQNLKLSHPCHRWEVEFHKTIFPSQVKIDCLWFQQILNKILYILSHPLQFLPDQIANDWLRGMMLCSSKTSYLWSWYGTCDILWKIHSWASLKHEATISCNRSDPVARLFQQSCKTAVNKWISQAQMNYPYSW